MHIAPNNRAQLYGMGMVWYGMYATAWGLYRAHTMYMWHNKNTLLSGCLSPSLSPSFSLLAATTRQSDLSKDIATSWPYSTYSFCTAHLIIWHLESNWESKFPNLLNCFNLPWPASISDRKFRFVRFAFLALYTSWPRFIFRSALKINAKVGP